MRVCFISFEYPPNVLGGAGTYSGAVVNGLRRRGVDVFIITRGNLNNCDQRTFRLPTSNVLYWRRLFFITSATSLLKKLDKRWKFDLVHFNEPHIILRKPKVPVVSTLHSTQVNEMKLKWLHPRTLETVGDIGDVILKSSVGSICDLFTTRATDKIICPSYPFAKLIKSYCFVDEHKIHVIPNGIDLEAIDKIKNNDSSILDKYGLKRDNYLLFIGRLSILKGVQYLIKTFRTIKKDYSDLKLAIVGTGDSENLLRNLAHGIADIVFTGYVGTPVDKKLLYENCIAVVVPSLYEALPMVILEAMAYGKAVIASDVGGIPMMVKHGKNGFIVKPEDSKSLEKFIRILLENANLRKNLGSFGRKLVENEFTIDKMVGETLKVYESLL
jgi:1,4-alpha-glucan branching enzyme